MGDESVVLAHGIGGGQDLPIPVTYAVLGAAWALAVSFAVLAFAWRTPRFRGDDSGRPLPRWLARFVDSTLTRHPVRAFGLAFTAYVVMAALLGPDDLTNPTFGVVYVLVWVGLVPLSLLLGRVWTLLNPMRTVHLLLCRAAGTSPGRGLRAYPEPLGYWPAAAGLFAFVWLELVSPNQAYLSTVRVWFGLYAAAMLVGSAVFGSRWFERADPFEVYASLVARLSPFGRRGAGRPGDGRPVVRNPLENLDGLPPSPGLVAVVAVLFGSTGFDTFKDSGTWLTFVQPHDSPVLLDTAGLVAFIGVVYVSLTAATMLTGGLGHLPRRAMPAQFAHSVVPIVVGYVLAHYLTYLIVTGQQTLILLSDPLGRGWDVFGTADMAVGYGIVNSPGVVAAVQVLAVITGHVLGVISAHDRAVRLLPRRYAVVGQLPLLVLMVLYTVGGLTLLLTA